MNTFRDYIAARDHFEAYPTVTTKEKWLVAYRMARSGLYHYAFWDEITQVLRNRQRSEVPISWYFTRRACAESVCYPDRKSSRDAIRFARKRAEEERAHRICGS